MSQVRYERSEVSSYCQRHTQEEEIELVDVPYLAGLIEEAFTISSTKF